MISSSAPVFSNRSKVGAGIPVISENVRLLYPFSSRLALQFLAISSISCSGCLDLWHITISTKTSAHLKTGRRAYIRRRRTDIHGEAALLKHPVPGSRVIELQHIRSDRKVDSPCLPRL